MRSFTEFRKIRDVVAGREKADVLIQNARIVNVFTREIMQAPIAVSGGFICGFFECPAEKVYDAQGMYVVPGFIDAHMHIESTKVTPDKLNDVLLPHGVSMIVADPHEIANVCGTQGLDFILASTENLDLEVIVNLPSSVPASAGEHSGAELHSADLRPYYAHERVRTLAEVMDSTALRDDDDMLAKVYDAYRNSPVVDGHCVVSDDRGIDMYAALGIKNDHECISAEQALARIRRGMYVFIREGSVAKNLVALLPAVTEHTFRYMAFCTDDSDTPDVEHGHCVTAVVRKAIASGLDPLTAICMASLNPALCYGFTEKGAVAPGYYADFFLCDNLETLQPQLVFQHGVLVAEHGTVCTPKSCFQAAFCSNSVNFHPFISAELQLPLRSSRAHVMQVAAGNLVTYDTVAEVNIHHGHFEPSAEKDQALLCVVERHKQTGNIGQCIVSGFKMKCGAIATTVSHDSHNIICIGMNVRDMKTAIFRLGKIHGGYCVVENGTVTAEVPLPVGGLMSCEDMHTVSTQMQSCRDAVKNLCGDIDFNPFMMLSFIALPVIPEIKLTDSGLFDVRTGQILKIEAE